MHYQNQYVRCLTAWLTKSVGTSSCCLADSNPNWDHLLKTAADSAILPSLYRNAIETPLGAQLPEEISTLLTTAHVLNTDRNNTALAQARQLAAALNHVGIQPIALKGLANILAGIYPDLGSRYLADIDFLVSPDQFPAAIAVFQNLGYASYPAHPLELTIGHSYPPLNRPYSLEVDLHRTLGLGICPEFLAISELIGNSTLHNLDGASIRIPSANHLVIHHVMHSQMHDVYRERVVPSLRTLYDLFLLQRQFGESLDWMTIKSHFQGNGQYPTLALYLLEAEKSFGIELPFPLHLTPAIRLRRCRRELLQKWPILRFLDPFYYWFAGFQPRTRRLHEILSQPGGLHYLMQKFYRPNFYARLRADFR